MATKKLKSTTKNAHGSKGAVGQINTEILARRSRKVAAQIQQAIDLRQQLVAALLNLFPDALTSGDMHAQEVTFLRQIGLSAESFDVTFNARAPRDVDRTVSMLSGPFFTSKKYPIPTVSNEMLYPIVQLDLRLASAAIGEPLGDGLLQLWYDTNLDDGTVRVIPRSEVETSKATPFNLVPATAFDGFPLPSDWKSDPLGKDVQVFVELTSTGIACQEACPGIYLLERDRKVPREFHELNRSFEKCTRHQEISCFHLFGTASDWIQHSTKWIGKKCLFHIGSDWGISGHAQVLYQVEKSGNAIFTFQNTINVEKRKKLLLAKDRSKRPPRVAAFSEGDGGENSLRSIKGLAAKTKPASKAHASISNLGVNISRSKAVLEQVKKANALKRQIITKTLDLFPYISEEESEGSEERSFLRQMERSSESFDVIFETYSPDKIDRTVSMLSGPFYTCKGYPIPKANSKMMYPIVQIDLRVASEIIGERLGDGLLQLWYESENFQGEVRVIPRPNIDMSKATKFAFVPHEDMDGFPLPLRWESDPLGTEVRVISRFKSTGISSQNEYAELYLSDMDVPTAFEKLVEKFQKLTVDKGSNFFHLFGTFYPIQYSAADARGKCLCHIGGDWGSSGSAQIFYDIAENGSVSFAFWDCLR